MTPYNQLDSELFDITVSVCSPQLMAVMFKIISFILLTFTAVFPTNHSYGVQIMIHEEGTKIFSKLSVLFIYFSQPFQHVC